MRCLNALSDWEQLIKNTQDEPHPENRKQVMHLAANAAMNLGNFKILKIIKIITIEIIKCR